MNTQNQKKSQMTQVSTMGASGTTFGLVGPLIQKLQARDGMSTGAALETFDCSLKLLYSHAQSSIN